MPIATTFALELHQRAGHLPAMQTGLNRHLPRLERNLYRGFAAVHWSMTIRDRRRGWLTQLFHARFRECALHTMIRYRLFCPSYRLMPDHIHILLRGVHKDSDQLLAAAFLRRTLGAVLKPFEFQKQPYDHVLRSEDLRSEAFRSVAYYILENPVRAGIVKTANDYPFGGGLLPGKPSADVHHPEYWSVFWRMHMVELERNGYEG